MSSNNGFSTQMQFFLGSRYDNYYLKLFPRGSTLRIMDGKVYTISEISRIIKSTLESSPNLTSVWIKGELSNVTYHSSGHIYFTLKDEGAVMSAVFFKYANRSLAFRLEEGQSILAFGGINVFEKRGNYNFIVTQVKLEGIGELQKRIDQLKKKLLAEGIFDPRRKKKLPALPRRIGVITSPTGAAIRDILKVALRRFPNLEVIVAPAKVQGDDAAATIARGIEELNRPEWRIDLIIAGRGGGSFEDLMPFNEEAVIRAIAASRVPVISAVGHQIDHPLSDDAADVAAPTPSAAAEMAIPVRDELEDYITYLNGRSYNALTSRMRELNLKIESLQKHRYFREPREILYSRELVLSDLEKRLISAMKERIVERRNSLLRIPDMVRLIRNNRKEKEHRFTLAIQNLEALSPLAVLRRGYAIGRDERNRIIKSTEDVEAGEKIRLYLHDGRLNCLIQSKEKGEYLGKKETPEG